MKTLLPVNDDPVMIEVASDILELLETPILIAHDGRNGTRLYAANHRELT